MDSQKLLREFPRLRAVLAAEPELGAVLEQLESHRLLGVFPRYLSGASTAALANFLHQCQELDYRHIELHRHLLQHTESTRLGVEDVAPVSMVSLEQQARRRERDRRRGLESLRQGRWAGIAFAGGAGTRFFSALGELQQAIERPNRRLAQGLPSGSLPKGVFPISPVAGLSFYELIVSHALATGIACGRLPPVALMTSTITDQHTRNYLQGHHLWGLPAEHIIVFTQAHVVRLDEQGELVVADEQGNLSTTGNGHGGVYQALLAPRPDGPCIAERLAARGVEQLVMHNVDNAAARPFVPERLGFHLEEQALFTLSVVRKVDPAEKVGVPMLRRDSGRVEVVEYNVLDPEISRLRQPGSKRLLHEAGNANTNLVELGAIRADIEPTLYTGKRVASRRGLVSTSSLEMLNQHLTRFLDPERVRAYEIDRAELFMPTKGITGPASVQSTTTALSRRAARRLAAAGATLAEDVWCDLHAACEEPEQLVALGVGPGLELGPGSRLYLCAAPSEDEPPLFQGKLLLETGASLLVDCQRPWGPLHCQPDGTLRPDPRGRSRVSFEAGVRICPGVTVELTAGPGASITVSAGRVFDRDVSVVAAPGKVVEL